MKTKQLALGVCLIVPVVAVAAYLLGGELLMLVWNFVVPGTFHGPHLSYWVAVGLVILLSFIGGFFKGSGK